MREELTAESMGPVDVAVILFRGSRFNGDVAPSLLELQESGTIRIIDLAFVSRAADGSVIATEVSESEFAARFGGLTTEQLDLLSDGDLDQVGAGLEPGDSALVVVWEHTWARRLSDAVRGSRGEVVSLERIPREVVATALAALSDA
ncbi:hypothetical protein EDD29_7725 [Actinocorallia herbida]|uniref:DUF1269 domain-containing protein n=1 Tax=Actinocorallia herbida TaxID=58109 RepID=A0A3N1D8Z9_9ACTN|nr:DUF6325 family protein [Actinocorallia herbida]ROO90012.1 hypothetical protein EDD29_7725 [Actinocorallia herbida]